jgi:hypothetical protein
MMRAAGKAVMGTRPAGSGSVFGRPKLRPTDKEFEDNRRAKIELERAIESMAGNGLSPQEITLLTGIKPERLYRKYHEHILRGAARKKNAVADMGYLIATGGPDRDWRKADAGMIKFWLERQGGSQWAPPRKDEGPDLTTLSVEQLIELERALRPLAKTKALIDVAPTSSEVADATRMPDDG